MKRIVSVLLFSLFICCLFVSGKTQDAEIVAYTSIHTKEEYEQFIRENEFPDSFLFYDDLSFFGEFRWLYVPEKNMSSYTYEFYNESDLFVRLEVFDYEYNQFDHEVPPPEGDLMQNVYAEQFFSPGTPGLCYCVIGKFRFLYSHNVADSTSRLGSIKWENEDNTAYYSLYIDDLDPSKPLTGFLGDLLSAERSETARQQLYDLTVHGKKFEYPPAPAPFPWVWVIVPAGAVLICGGTAAFFLLRKKKKQES